MTDIVERLRWVARNCDQPICEEAADTIEGFIDLLEAVNFHAQTNERFSPALRDRIADEMEAWAPVIKTEVVPLDPNETIEDIQRDIDRLAQKALDRQDWIGG